MNRSDKPIIGILGGMGPAATAEFFARLTSATPATSDQDHFRVLVWSDATVPDRSAALLHGHTDPTAWILHGADLLANAGADLLAVPCNTAHAFLDPLKRHTNIVIVHMIEATANQLSTLTPRIRRVGLLATAGTVVAGLYDDPLRSCGIDIVKPDRSEQDRISNVIRAFKAGHRGAHLSHAVGLVGDRLVARGADALLAACTEISMVLPSNKLSVPIIDATDALVAAVISTATQTRATRRLDASHASAERRAPPTRWR